MRRVRPVAIDYFDEPSHVRYIPGGAALDQMDVFEGRASNK